MSSEEKKEEFDDVYIGGNEGGAMNWSPKSIVNYAKSDAQYKIRVVLLGDSGVGKTSIIRRWAKDEFYPRHDRTLGLDTEERVISVNGDIVHLVVTDTAGHGGFITVHDSTSKQANGCFFVFDLTNEDSLKNIERVWLPQFRRSNERAQTFLIGTKLDKENTSTVISDEEAEQFRETHGLRKYYKTSSLTGNGIDSVFQTIAFYVLRDHRNEVECKENVIFRANEPGQAADDTTCWCVVL